MPSLLAAAIGEMRRMREEADRAASSQPPSSDGLAHSYWQGRYDALSESIPMIERVDRALDVAFSRCSSRPDKVSSR